MTNGSVYQCMSVQHELTNQEEYYLLAAHIGVQPTTLCRSLSDRVSC